MGGGDSMNYTDGNRGVIQNRERASQIIDYSNIRYGLITPTDIDGFFEWHNKIFVFYEMKLNGATMPRGQRVALQRLVDGLRNAGKFPVLFLCEHNVNDCSCDIVAANTIVKSIYLGNGLEKPGRGLTAKQATDIWFKWASEKAS